MGNLFLRKKKLIKAGIIGAIIALIISLVLACLNISPILIVIASIFLGVLFKLNDEQVAKNS